MALRKGNVTEGELGYRVREGFVVPDARGNFTGYPAGRLIRATDPVVRTHLHFLTPITEHIEQATAAPGERRDVRIPVPRGEAMPHPYPPEDERSAASPFATRQPGAGVVADDVPEEQNPAGGPKAKDATDVGKGYAEEQAKHAEGTGTGERRDPEALKAAGQGAGKGDDQGKAPTPPPAAGPSSAKK